VATTAVAIKYLKKKDSTEIENATTSSYRQTLSVFTGSFSFYFKLQAKQV
jgi:hypothetical protein